MKTPSTPHDQIIFEAKKVNNDFSELVSCMVEDPRCDSDLLTDLIDTQLALYMSVQSMVDLIDELASDNLLTYK
jgi:hypothetical protein